MYRNNNKAYRQPYNNESDMELNPEFDLEGEYDNEYGTAYQSEEAFENEDETDFEYEPEYELDPEYDMESEADYENSFDMESEFDRRENEYEQDYENEADEMETELEYVTNEQELENWVNEIVVRTRPGLRPVLRTPIGRRAVRQISKIAFKTLPYIGRQRRGWRRPYAYRRPLINRFVRPIHRRWPYRGRWNAVPGVPPPYFQYANQDMGQQQQGFQDTNPQQGSQIQQDGSFKNFVLDTIKNLSEQIAKGNENVEALKNSITNSAVNNFPTIVQPVADKQAPSSPDTPMNEPPKTAEFEMEDYEYENEYDNESDGEIADNESSFNEVTEMELASELLSVSNEMELDHFLQELVQKAVGNYSSSGEAPQSEILRKIFKKVIKKVLPVLAGAAGTALGGPVVGLAASKAANNASKYFEMELEGLSHEDSEFEIAKAFVRFAGNAAKEAKHTKTGNPARDAEHALIQASRRFAPGLLRRRINRFNQPRTMGDWGESNTDNSNLGNVGGRWYRRGNKIILIDAF